MGKTKCSQCGSKSHLSCEVQKDRINGLQIFDKDIETALEDRLEALIEDLQPPLLAHLSKKREPFKPLMIRVRILGNDEASAKPWIVVHCPSVVVRDVEAFFMKDIARTMFADMDITDGLEVAFVGRPIRTRAGLITEVEVSFASVDVNLPQPWSGPIILAQHPHTHRATMGGMLVVDNQHIESIFGLTVGHLFQRGDIDGLQASDEDTVVTVHDEEAAAAAASAQSRPLGSIVDASFSKYARDLDWALIQFSKTTQLSDFVAEEPKYEKFSEGNCKGPVTFRPNPLPWGSAKLSSLPASVILPVGEKFIKVYPIVISGVQGFELPAGTSGCWVTTESFGSNAEHGSFREVAVHGVIIADDCFGDIYMVPLDDIMISMEEALSGMSVSLPSDTLEIVRLLHEQSFRMDAQTVDRRAVNTTQISKFAPRAPMMFSTAPQPLPPPPVPGFSNPPAAGAGPLNLAQSQASSHGWSKVIWFCSDCGDGPSQPWNLHCGNCGHARCSACNVEEA